MGNKSFRIKIIPGIMVYKKCDKLTSFAGFFLLQALQFFLQLKKQPIFLHFVNIMTDWYQVRKTTHTEQFNINKEKNIK